MKLRMLGLSALLCASMQALPAFAQSTEFTYQGRLQQSGGGINATADFEFKLFNSSTGGAQIGSTQISSNVTVAHGYFAATMDFGASAFNGDARWLQIAVRSPAGSGAFTTLAPRQPIRPAPYALKVSGVDGHSLDAADGSPANALFVDNTGNVGIGTTTPLGPFDVRSGNGSYVMVDGINGDLHLNGGTDAVAGLYNDSTGPDARTDFVVNNWPQMVITGEGRVGIGTIDPWYTLDVQSDWLTAINAEATSGNGIRSLTGGGSAAAVNATNVSSTGQAFGVLASSTSPGGRAIHAIATASSGVPIAVSGWCNSSSGYDFFAGGAGINYGSSSSRRWKHNIETIDDPVGKLARMRGVYFDWDAEHGGHHDVGMIAEEVGKVLPEVVSYEENGVDAIGMDYSKVAPLLVEAVKQQQARIDELQHANAELREQLANLAQRMTVLER